MKGFEPKDARPPAHLLDARGRLKRHPFEEAHDDPAPASICWHCHRRRTDKIHVKGQR